MGKKDLTCIGCPLGCNLEVFIEANKEISVKGQSCKRGEVYGIKECTCPTRILTTTVCVRAGELAVVSVKTEKDIPKDYLGACIKELKKIKLNAPVHTGEVIVYDILKTGVNVIATMNVNRV